MIDSKIHVFSFILLVTGGKSNFITVWANATDVKSNVSSVSEFVFDGKSDLTSFSEM